MEANRYRTVGEMMYRDPVFAEHKRNKAENYLSTVKRDQIIDEARLVFAAQRQYGATWASPEMEARVPLYSDTPALLCGRSGQRQSV